MYPNSVAQPGAQVDQEAIVRARYFAQLQRRSMPPRCNPIAIVILVLSAGMLFIGLTMTVIANWPGASSIGENPLKIAGPVLLAVGGVVFILGLVLSSCLSKRERLKWEQNLANFAAQKSMTNLSHQPLQASYHPTAGQYAGESNETSQSKTALRTSKGSSDGTGPPSYSMGNGVRGYPGNVDPAVHKSGGPHDNSFDSNSQVPDPVRITKPRNTSRGPGSSTTSPNESLDFETANVKGQKFDPKSSKKTASPTHYANLEDQPVDTPQKGRKRERATGKKSGEEEELLEASRRNNDGAQAYGEIQGKGTGPNGAAGSGVAGAPNGGKGSDQQHLRLHIRAQPGTAVLITPTATPPRGSPPMAKKPEATYKYPKAKKGASQGGDSSAETEI